MNLDKKTALSHIEHFKDQKLLVIGDIILDEFIWGKVRRISPEAPVPVVEVERESLCLGGSANVVNNLHALGCKVALCGVIGKDENGARLKNILEDMDVDCGGVIVKEDRPTAIKTRVIAQHQQIVRFDREKPSPISEYSKGKIIDYLKGHLDDIGAVIISDYGKGVISEDILSKIIPIIREKNVPIAVDPKPVNFPFYQGVTVITPNHHEAADASGIDTETEKGLIETAKKLIASQDSESILITRGENGMSLFERDGTTSHIPTVARDVYDVSGAGDTVISTMALALASGAKLKEAAILSNYAAGIVVGKLGTAPITLQELRERVEKNND